MLSSYKCLEIDVIKDLFSSDDCCRFSATLEKFREVFNLRDRRIEAEECVAFFKTSVQVSLMIELQSLLLRYLECWKLFQKLYLRVPYVIRFAYPPLRHHMRFDPILAEYMLPPQYPVSRQVGNEATSSLISHGIAARLLFSKDINSRLPDMRAALPTRLFVRLGSQGHQTQTQWLKRLQWLRHFASGTDSPAHFIDETTVTAPHCGLIRTLSLNRPRARNAISRQLLGELANHIRRLREEGSKGPTRALILASSLDDCFCAGADLKV